MNKINYSKFKNKNKEFFQIPFLLETIWKHLIKISNISSEESFYKKTLKVIVRAWNKFTMILRKWIFLFLSLYKRLGIYIYFFFFKKKINILTH